MEVMLPRSPGAVNGSPWETKSSPQVGTDGPLPPATISTAVTSNGDIDCINELGTRSPIDQQATRQITSSPSRRRTTSPRAVPLLSVASLSASFHTDTTMSRFKNIFSDFFNLKVLNIFRYTDIQGDGDNTTFVFKGHRLQVCKNIPQSLTLRN